MKNPSFKLYISPYRLEFKKPKAFLPPLKGALLAFEFESNRMGYSDFLPWPAFYELSLSQQLKQAQQGLFSSRFLIAMQNAALDAQARDQKRNLFFGLKIPESHFLIEDILEFHNESQIEERGFKIVKAKLKPLKIRRQIDCLRSLTKALPGLKWRIDLNGGDWALWKNQLGFMREKIDFIEDPVDFREKDRALFAQDWPGGFKQNVFAGKGVFDRKRGKEAPLQSAESAGPNSSQRGGFAVVVKGWPTCL